MTQQKGAGTQTPAAPATPPAPRPDQANVDNRANQLNPNNPAYHKARRGQASPPDTDEKKA